jgi:hypothetical protein
MEVLLSAEEFSHQFLPEKAPDFQIKKAQDMGNTRSARIVFSELCSQDAQNMEVSLRSEEFSHNFPPEKALMPSDPRSVESFFKEISPEKVQSDKFSPSAEVFFPKSSQKPIALPHANSAIFPKTEISQPISNLPILSSISPFWCLKSQDLAQSLVKCQELANTPLSPGL